MEERNFGYLGATFQQSLIKAIIEDKKYGENIIDVIESRFFDNNAFKFIMENLKELYKLYNKIPDYNTLAQKIMAENGNKESARIHIDTLEIIKSSEPTEYVKDTALNFCKQQNLKRELKNVQSIIENGEFENYAKIEQIIQKALQVGIINDDATDVFHDIEGALEKDFRHPIPTGIVGIDNLLKGGLGIGELGVVLAPTGTGKSLPISEPILTPNGWMKIGDIKCGDKIIGSDGNEQFTIGVFPQGNRPIYRVEFTDNTFVNCDQEHLWSVNTLNMRTTKIRKNGISLYKPNNNYKVMKTSEMMLDIKKRGRYNYRLPIVEPINFNEKEVFIDPYLLGLLLGDGCLGCGTIQISTKDDEIFDNIKHLNIHTSFNEYERETLTGIKTIKKISFNYRIKKDLEKYNLLGTESNNKFIPNDYLYNSFEVRLSILQGLMDTDGYVDKKGGTQITTISKELSLNIREIVLSLGGTCNITLKQPTFKYKGFKKLGQIAYVVTISFSNNIVPFRLIRKIERFRKRKKYISQKYIKSINFSHNEEAVCIKVSNTDELFVTRDYVLTHNTTLLTKFANTAYNLGYNVLQVFFEDNPGNIKRKHYTIWSGIAPDEQSDNKDEVLFRVKEIQSNTKGSIKLLKLQSDGVTISEIKSKIRKMCSDGFKVDLLLIDYIDCISPERSVNGDEWKGEGSIMRQLESMTSEFEMAVWTATQGNRCVWIKTIVDVESKGKIEIKDISVGDKILTHIGFKEVTYVSPIQTQPTYKIKTKSGKEIIVSDKHLFPVNYNKYKSIRSGLSVGDKLLIKQ